MQQTPEKPDDDVDCVRGLYNNGDESDKIIQDFVDNIEPEMPLDREINHEPIAAELSPIKSPSQQEINVTRSKKHPYFSSF